MPKRKVKPKAHKAPPKVGRPYGFKPKYIQQAQELAESGATDVEIAAELGCSVPTLYSWRAKEPALFDAIKNGKAIADERVELSLYARASGYQHPDSDIRVIDGAVVITPIVKHYPPDPTSMIFWLKNRNPAKWRERVEHTGPDGGPLQITVVKYGEKP